MHSISSSAIILDTVVKSTLLLAIAWGAALVLKKRSAATQHMVRAFALAALLLLPISVMVLPAWHIKGIPQYPKSQPATQQTDAQIALSPSTIAPRKAATTSMKHTGASVATAPTNARVKQDQAHAAKSFDTQPSASVNASTVVLKSSPTSAEVEPSQRTTATTRLANLSLRFCPSFCLASGSLAPCSSWLAGA